MNQAWHSLAQQWLGTVAVLLGLLINQAGALRSMGRGWLERRRSKAGDVPSSQS